MGWSTVDLSRNPPCPLQTEWAAGQRKRHSKATRAPRDVRSRLSVRAGLVGRVLVFSPRPSAGVHFRVIWLRPKGNNYTEEAAGARHAHMTVPSHSRLKPLGRSPHQTKITCGTEGFSRRLASVRDFAGAQPRAGQKKCERGRESAAPGKLVSSRGRYRRRLRRVFGREEEARAKSKAGGFSTPSAGYTRLMLQIVAQPPARRAGVGR